MRICPYPIKSSAGISGTHERAQVLRRKQLPISWACRRSITARSSAESARSIWNGWYRSATCMGRRSVRCWKALIPKPQRRDPAASRNGCVSVRHARNCRRLHGTKPCAHAARLRRDRSHRQKLNTLDARSS